MATRNVAEVAPESCKLHKYCTKKIVINSRIKYYKV